MSKLHQYIVEGDRRKGMEWDTWVKEVKKKCRYALKVTELSKHVFWHIDRTVQKGKTEFGRMNKVFKAKTRPQRKPLDTVDYAHKIIDDWFKKKFGWRARTENVVFAEGQKMFSVSRPWTATGQAIIFPVGNPFKYIWSPKIADITADLEIGKDDLTDWISNKWDNDPLRDEDPWYEPSKEEMEDLKDERKKEIIKELDKNLKDGDYQDNDILKAMKTRKEIMIQCKEYYVLLVSQYSINDDLEEVLAR